MNTSIDLDTKLCLEFIIMGHSITAKSWNDGYDGYSDIHVSDTNINSLVEGWWTLTTNLEYCPLVTCTETEPDSDTTVQVFTRSDEYNPAATRGQSIQYGMESITRNESIYRLDRMLNTLKSIQGIDGEPIANGINGAISALQQQQQQAREAYLALRVAKLP